MVGRIRSDFFPGWAILWDSPGGGQGLAAGGSQPIDMQSPTQLIERALASLQELARRSPQLAREQASTRPSFTTGSDAAAALGARRHLEWFLLERPSEHLEGVPVEVLGEEWLAESEGSLGDVYEGLLKSHASAFLVSRVEPGQGLVLQDLMGLSEFDVREDAGSALLEVGDLLVGRVYPVADDQVLLSGAMHCFRDSALVSALKRDVESLRGGRRGVLRMQQIELERMFFPATGETMAELPSPAERKADAHRDLIAAGLEEEEVRRVMGEVLGARSGQVVTEVLNHLAFHTDIDLERAREALVDLWGLRNAGLESPGPDENGAAKGRNGVPASSVSSAQAGSGAKRGPLDFFRAPGAPENSPSERSRSGPLPEDSPGGDSPSETGRSVRAALADFDAGRAAGKDIETLFGQLEADLDLASIDSGESNEEGAPDFPGVVGAMLAEFRWEAQRERGEELEPAGWKLLDAFAEANESVGIFEDLPAESLLAFVTRDALDGDLLESQDDAQHLLGAMDAFAAWCDEHHGLELAQDFRARLGGLSQNLPRLTAARKALGAGAQPGGSLFEVALVGGARLSLRAIPEGGAPEELSECEVQVPEPVARHLQSGDFVRVKNASSTGELIGVHPPEARSVLWPT